MSTLSYQKLIWPAAKERHRQTCVNFKYGNQSVHPVCIIRSFHDNQYSKGNPKIDIHLPVNVLTSIHTNLDFDVSSCTVLLLCASLILTLSL